jgi:hypothetical protein
MADPADHPVTPKKVDPDAMHNPSTGVLVRNPSHVEVAERAEDQRQIVDAIKASGATWQKAIYDYSDRSRIPGLPGALKLRDMNEPNMLGFCATLLRAKPNITGILVKFGDYPSAREYTGPKVSRIRSHQPRPPSEIAEYFASLLSDPTLHVVELRYTVNNAAPGNFESIATAKVANPDEYDDERLFEPRIEIEYLSM